MQRFLLPSHIVGESVRKTIQLKNINQLTIMKFLKLSKILLLIIVVLAAACEKENFDEINVGTPDYQPEIVEVNTLITALQLSPNDGLEMGCISIQFPFDVILQSGISVTINSTTDFEAVANGEDQVVDFEYPIVVTTEDGENLQVNSSDELGILFGSCIPDYGWDDTTDSNGTFTIPAFLFAELCFDLVYPVDVEDASENTYTANTEAELIDLLATTTNLSFILPIMVVDEEGNETTIESVAGFYDLYYSCEGNTPPGTEGGLVIDLSELDSVDCNFESLAIQYPYNVITEDGESITVENENQEAALILSGQEYTIQYPFNLVDETGGVTTINNETEFILLILPCLITVEDPAEPCDTEAHVLLFFNAHNIFTIFDCPFDINYPVDVTVDGATVTLNDVYDYFDETGAPSNIGDVELIYPITVTVAADGSNVELNSDQDVCDFITACE